MWQDIVTYLMDPGGFLPHGYCLQWRPDLLWLHVLSSLTIGMAYFVIPVVIFIFVRKRSDLRLEHKLIGTLFCAFIMLCGTTHFIEILTLWIPAYGLQGIIKALTALVSVLTAVMVWPLLPQLLRLPTPSDMENVNAQLRAEISAREDAYLRLERARDDLETAVTERTQELGLIQDRFESALRGARVVVFVQDRNLRYSWISQHPTRDLSTYMGHTDLEVLNPECSGPIISMKQRAITTGKTQEGEISYSAENGGPVTWYRLHIDPYFDEKGNVEGINCVAVDITDIKDMEQEQLRLTGELATTLQRYQLAMQSSNVIVFTQDAALAYTSISRGMLGRAADSFIGQTDKEMLPENVHSLVIPLKQRVLETGVPERVETPIRLENRTLWYDLYINPLYDNAGRIIGLTCAAVDTTERKGWEEHLRLLMRELTHRSKNLLAVIQAMARQTARHADTVDKFVEQFSARLQALGGAHDLLVRESWHGVGLMDLVKSQLGHYADLLGSQISLKGPHLFLAPEPSQNLGMALHEMATNAAKYGALSTPQGKVEISWAWDNEAAEESDRKLRLDWREHDGPPVSKPTRKGFGTQVVERNLVRSLSATVDLDYAADGFRASILIPADSLLAKKVPLEIRMANSAKAA